MAATKGPSSPIGQFRGSKPHNPDDYEQLCDELVSRIRKHPVRDWPPELLGAVISVIDLHFGPPVAQPDRQLRLVT